MRSCRSRSASSFGTSHRRFDSAATAPSRRFASRKLTGEPMMALRAHPDPELGVIDAGLVRCSRSATGAPRYPACHSTTTTPSSPTVPGRVLTTPAAQPSQDVRDGLDQAWAVGRHRSNMPCARETIACQLEDVANGLVHPAQERTACSACSEPPTRRVRIRGDRASTSPSGWLGVGRAGHVSGSPTSTACLAPRRHGPSGHRPVGRRFPH